MRRTLVATCLALGLIALSASTASAHTLTPSSHDFGQVPTGKMSAYFTFTVTAQGTPMSGISHTVSGADFQAVTAPTDVICGSLNPGQSCNYSVWMFPQSAGPKTGTLSVTANGGVNLTASLTGTGVSTSPPPTVKTKCKKKKHRSAIAAKKRCKKK